MNNANYKWSSDYSDNDCDCTALSVRAILPSAQQEAQLQEQLPVVASNDNQDVNNDQPTFTETTSEGHSLTVNW